MSGKEIWLPSTETRVQVVDGKVSVWDEILMELKPVRGTTGFSSRDSAATARSVTKHQQRRRRKP